MQNTILLAILAGALAGVGGAFVSQALLAPADVHRPVEESLALEPGSDVDAGALAEQVAALSRKNDDLVMRLSALENRMGSSLREEVPTESSEEIAALQRQVVQLAMALDNPASAESVSLRKAVGSALEDIRAAEEAEREKEREEREARRMDEQVARLTEELGLDSGQAKDMRNLMDSERLKREELFATMRDGTMNREDMRDSMGSLRDDWNTALAGILTPAQLQTYNDSNLGRTLNNFGRGGGGRGGGGFGGGGFGAPGGGGGDTGGNTGAAGGRAGGRGGGGRGN